MGQCNLNDIETNYFGDMFDSQASDDSSFLSKQPIHERDRMLWEHELNASQIIQVPDKSFWNQNNNLTHPCFHQISKDITRTYPQQPFFGVKNNLDKFQKILKKFALYFPKVGYTQGLNFITGFLLISGCQAEQSFNLLVKMMLHDRILAIGLYEDGFPLNRLYCEMFWLLLQKKIPKLYEKLKKANIPDEMWIFQWFLTLFLYNFPIPIAKCFWDFILSKKQFGPVLVALGILKVLKNELMDIELHDEVDFLQFTANFKDIEFCRIFLDMKKIFTFANSISKSDIERALSQTKPNQYRDYFAASLYSKRQQWQSIYKQLQIQRQTFRQSNEPKHYERCEQMEVIQHLQKLVLSKYKLYQSEIRNSNHGSVWKRSNCSIPGSNRSTPSKMPVQEFSKYKL